MLERHDGAGRAKNQEEEGRNECQIEMDFDDEGSHRAMLVRSVVRVTPRREAGTRDWLTEWRRSLSPTTPRRVEKRIGRFAKFA